MSGRTTVNHKSSMWSLKPYLNYTDITQTCASLMPDWIQIYINFLVHKQHNYKKICIFHPLVQWQVSCTVNIYFVRLDTQTNLQGQFTSQALWHVCISLYYFSDTHRCYSTFNTVHHQFIQAKNWWKLQ